MLAVVSSSSPSHGRSVTDTHAGGEAWRGRGKREQCSASSLLASGAEARVQGLGGPQKQRGQTPAQPLVLQMVQAVPLCSVWSVDHNLISCKLVKNVCKLKFYVTKIFTFCN